MPAQFINRIADLERFREVSAVPMLFGSPGLCVLFPKPSQVFILYRYSNDIEHLQGFILWTLARFLFSTYYFSISSRLYHIPFEKQLTAFNIKESAKSCLTLSKKSYVFVNRFYFVAIEFFCLIYDFKLAVFSATCYIAQPIFHFLSFAILGLFRTPKTICILSASINGNSAFCGMGFS